MKSVHKFFTENLHYKIIAVVFSVLLWFLAANKEITETTLTVKYTIIPAGDYQIVDYSPKELKLKVEGYRREIIQLKEEGKVKVLLPGELPQESGWIEWKLNKDSIKLPFSTLKVKSVSPKKIRVKVEKLIRKAVPVKVELTGLTGKVKIRVIPNYAVVSLPEDSATSVISVKTEKVDVSEVKFPAVIEVNLKSRYRVEPQKVEIILEAEDEGKEKTIWNGWN